MAELVPIKAVSDVRVSETWAYRDFHRKLGWHRCYDVTLVFGDGDWLNLAQTGELEAAVREAARVGFSLSCPVRIVMCSEMSA